MLAAALRAIFPKFGFLPRFGCLVLAGALALAACGGGGGGGGSGGGGGGGPSGASQARLEFPTTVTASFAEGQGFQSADTTFSFTAPTSEIPANVQLTGADARFFQVAILATDPPDAGGRRMVTLRTTALATFDYENPGDENRDNIYTFLLAGVYRGETLTATFNITVTDVLDVASGAVTVIGGEATNQIFGAPILSIPDLTGDGKPELGVSVQSGLGPASVYIISSEFYGSVASGALNVANLGTAGTKFQQTPVTPALANPNRLIAQQNLRANLLSAMPAATGTGTEILLSDAQRKKMYLWKFSSPTDYAAFRGSIDPDTAPNAIVYSFDGASGDREGRLIGDVNGDGINDIFVQSIRQTSGSQFGVIFGRAAAPGDLARNGAFDITFTTSSRFGGFGLPHLVVQPIADADRDGNRELAISAPATTGLLSDSSTSGKMWVIRSAVLRGGTGQTVNLDSLAANQGVSLNSDGTFAMIEADDTDGDGLKTFVSANGQNGRAVDGDQLLATGLTVGQSGTFGEISMAPSNHLGLGGNLDGDTVDDFVSAPNNGNFAFVVPGARIKGGLVSPAPTIAGSLRIDFRRVSYAQIEVRPPIFLRESGLVAFGIASQDGLNGVGTGPTLTAGEVVLVKESDIRRSVTQASTGLELHQ